MEFTYFACTSEDINNLSYALMLRDGVVMLKFEMMKMIDVIVVMGVDYVVMLMMSCMYG